RDSLPIWGSIIRFWDLATKREFRRLETSPFAGALTFSPDGRWLVGQGDLRAGFSDLGRQDYTLRVWDLTTGKTVPLEAINGAALGILPPSRDLLRGAYCAAFSWDG